MKKDVLINIIGTQDDGENQDKIELMTQGKLFQKANDFYLWYEDSEATGYAGSHTVVKVEGNDRVTMTRRGGHIRSELVVEKGRRHLCHYDTGYGELIIGVFGSDINSRLNENGGDIDFTYTLDVNTGFESKNSINIQVRETEVSPS